MADALGSYGEHIHHQDFYQFVADSSTSVPLGDGELFAIGTSVNTQTVDETDGVIQLVSASGAGNVSGYGVNSVYSPAANGPLILEVRLKFPTLADAAWVGFSDSSGDVDEVVDNGTIDGSVTDCAGIYYDDAVDTDQWNEYIATGGTETQQNLITEVITADEWQVLRVEILPDGTVRTLIADEPGSSGVGTGGFRLIAERTAAVSPTALFFPEVYVASNSGTGLLEVDYFHFRAQRNWAVD